MILTRSQITKDVRVQDVLRDALYLLAVAPTDKAGRRMMGLDLSGLDFTGDFLDESAFNVQILAADFRSTKLRQCGFSGADLACANLRGTDLSNTAMVKFYALFISHSSLDKAFARKLYDDLRAIGVKCWFDNVYPDSHNSR